MKPCKKVEILIYKNQDGMSMVEYKGRAIQNYGYQDDEDIHMCHFVLHENGEEDKEFFCLLEAIQHIDKVTK